jgi:hypothetical protein
VDASARGRMATEIVRTRYQWNLITNSYLELLTRVAEEKARAYLHQANSKSILQDVSALNDNARDVVSGVPVQASERLG